MRLDAAHDAIETLVALEEANKVHYIVKWNPCRNDVSTWRNRVFAEGKVSQTQPREKVGILVTPERKEVDKKTLPLSESSG